MPKKNKRKLRKYIGAILRYAIIKKKFSEHMYKKSPLNVIRKRYKGHCEKVIRSIPDAETLKLVSDILHDGL